MTGIDLGFVPVVRTPAGDPTPADLGARAYTRDAVVHLPEQAGDDDRLDNQALLAHELTHVLQQRALGPAADEHGPLGPALEAQAAAVEQGMRGEYVDPLDWALPEQATASSTPFLTWTPDQGFSTHGNGSAVDGWTEPDLAPPSWAPTQRAPSAPAAVVTGGGDGDGPVVRSELSALPEPEPESVPLMYPADLGPEPATAASEPSPAPTAQLELTDELLATIAGRLRVVPPPPLDTDDPALLDVLATGLYPRLRRRLRSELLQDRERTGLLTELH
jgi:hypothetical protein